MKIVYIAHPIKGMAYLNILNVLKIIRDINFNEPDVVPLAPYLIDCMILNDDHPDLRKKRMANNKAILESGMLDEIRLYGDRLSPSMIEAVQIGIRIGIPIVRMTDQMKEAFERWLESKR